MKHLLEQGRKWRPFEPIRYIFHDLCACLSEATGNTRMLDRTIKACKPKRSVSHNSLSLKKSSLFLPAFRTDGVGIQIMMRIVTAHLAGQSDAVYVHLPFVSIAHRNETLSGHVLTSGEWARAWEKFFNFGDDYTTIKEVVDANGKVAVLKQIVSRKRKLGKRKDSQEDRLINFLNSRNNEPNSHTGIYSFSLELCKRYAELGFGLDATFIRSIWKKFEKNGFSPRHHWFSPNFLNIVIHIRRGDVWKAIQSGSPKEQHLRKMIDESYYVNFIDVLKDTFEQSPRPPAFHIISDGTQEDFKAFEFLNEREAQLTTRSGRQIEDISFYLCEDTFDSLYHLIEAPVLFPGKSSFGAMAALYNKNIIIHDSMITDFYAYGLFEHYMKDNSRFIPLSEVRNRTGEILKATTHSQKTNPEGAVS